MSDVDVIDHFPSIAHQDVTHPDHQATVTDFSDYTEYFPADLRRSLTLIKQCDESYHEWTNKVNELVGQYQRQPETDPAERADPVELRAKISEALDNALLCREASAAEANRICNVTERHAHRLVTIRKKLEALPKPPSRDPTPAPVSPPVSRSRRPETERPPRLKLVIDGERDADAGARVPNQRGGASNRRVTIPGGIIASLGDEYEKYSSDSEMEDATATKPQKIKIPKVPRLKVPGLGTDVHSRVAGISTSNALARLTPPPVDAVLGSRHAPWMRLTEYEMAKLRKQMKKNAVWTPSATMVERELHVRGRGAVNMERTRREADEKGIPFVDADNDPQPPPSPPSVAQVMETPAMDIPIDPEITGVMSETSVSPNDVDVQNTPGVSVLPDPMDTTTDTKEIITTMDPTAPAPATAALLAGYAALNENAALPSTPNLTATSVVADTPKSKTNEGDESITKVTKSSQKPKQKKELAPKEQAVPIRRATDLEEANKAISDMARSLGNLFGASPTTPAPVSARKETKTPKTAKKRKRDASPEIAHDAREIPEGQDPSAPSNTKKLRIIPPQPVKSLETPVPLPVSASQASASPIPPPSSARLTMTIPLAPVGPSTPVPPPGSARELPPSLPSPTEHKQTLVPPLLAPTTAADPMDTIDKGEAVDSVDTTIVASAIELVAQVEAPVPQVDASVPVPAPLPVVTAAASRSRRSSIAPKEKVMSPEPQLAAPRSRRSSIVLKDNKNVNPEPSIAPSLPPLRLRSRPSSRSGVTMKAASVEPLIKQEASKTHNLRRASNVSLPTTHEASIATPAPTRTRRKRAPGPVEMDENGKDMTTVAQRKKKGHKRSKSEEDVDDDADEVRYCVCNDVSHGQMIACSNEDSCEKQWFHFACVGFTETDMPGRRDKWYCPDCQKKLRVDAKGLDNSTGKKGRAGVAH